MSRAVLTLGLIAGASTQTGSVASAQGFPDPDPRDQADLRLNSEYERGLCPANDIVILGAGLDTGSDCNDCEPGTTVTADLIITIDHGTNSSNRFLGVFGNLTETKMDGTTEMCSIARCSGPVLRNSDETNDQQTLNYGEITFTCGSTLQLSDLLLVWTAANGECPVTPQNNPNGKYCFDNPVIDVAPPFSAVLMAECAGANANIDLTVMGGVGPFTYLWSNGAMTEDLFGVPLGTYTVTVMDMGTMDENGRPCQVTESITFDGPCVPTDCGISGDASICEGVAAFYTATAIGATSFTWSFQGATNGAIFCSAPTDNPVCVLPGSGDFTLVVVPSNDSGDGDPCSIDVSVTPLPQIMCPPDVTVECTESTDPSNTGMPMTMNAGSVTFTDSTTPGDCLAELTITRTWTATQADDCVGEVSCQQVITVVDSVAPEITCPPDQNLEWTFGFDANDPANTGGAATATDACDPDPTVSFSDARTPGNCDGNFVIVRTWTATDECGNSSSCDQTIVVNDTVAPEITCPPDQDIEWTLGFDANDPAGTGGAATATDACDPDPLVTFSDALTPGNCDGNFMIVRTWTATDECGNSSSCDQTIVVSDTVAPEITCPPDQDLEWALGLDTSPANAGGAATATDACDPNPMVTFSDALTPGDCASDFVIVRTWTATDECGHSASCDQTITVSDTVAPEITCPPDQDLEWALGLDTSPANAGGDATATDACDPNPMVSFSDAVTPGDCAGDFVIVRTWTATDECGNSASCDQTIAVNDTVAPEITCPPDQDIEWTLGFDANDPANTGGAATATDACDPNPMVAFSDALTPGNCDGNFVIVRTWTATDECGNSSSCDQTIVVSDTVAPEITCPPDQDLEWTFGFDANDPANTGGAATATDACDPNPTVSFSDARTPGNCDGNFVIVRTWTATDECGNSSSCDQAIIVSDTVAPEITCPSDQDIEWTLGFDANDPAGTGGAATATDACDPDPMVTFSDALTPGNCDGNFVIVRTWTATDECGNAASCDQTITVSDTVAPEITCPPDQDLEWALGLDTSPANAGGDATATDACDPNPTVSFSDAVTPGDCAGDFVIVRTWTATDECGNSASCDQTIAVNDTVAPEITCPPDQDFEWALGLDTSPPNTGGDATATDACDSSPTVTFSDALTPGNCDGNFVIVRTWTATDECGNSSSCDQTIVVSDTVAPEITCPPDQDLEWTFGFDANDPANTGGAATATDACDPNPTVSFSDARTPGNCDGNFVIVRTWTATDECGNSSSCDQAIIVSDTVAPEITCPSDQDIEWTLGFDANDPAGTGGAATATDACDPDPMVTFSDALTPGNCDGNFVIVRTWTATDDCGNAASCDQTITVSDTVAPEITCPPDQDLEWALGLDTSPANAGGDATATDACDPNPTVSFSDAVTPGDCAGDFVIVRTWTATDECGNSASCDQTIAVNDTVAPEITCPPDQDFEWALGLDTSPPNTGGDATATDACDPSPTVTFSDALTPGNCDGNFVIVRTWTATDECGNSASCDQTITVSDTVPPEITCPPDQDLEWTLGFDASDPANTGGTATATDTCDPNPDVAFSDALTPGNCDGNFVIVRTWTATDECGNSSSCDQTIVVSDTVAPEITCPSDQDLEWTLGFDASNPAGTGGAATATDACDPNPDVSFSDELMPGDCDGNFVIVRTWTATDECGNSSSCDQTITVSDTVAPEITCPPDQALEWTLGFDAGDPASTGGAATATDACDPSPVVTFSDSLTPGDCAGDFVIVRTWTATDECGHSASCDQTITVNDTVAPEITCPPDQVLDWTPGFTGADPADTGGDATATDACDPSPVITFRDVLLPTECESDFTIVRTWTATDECGNSSSCVQTIVVRDPNDCDEDGIPDSCETDCDDDGIPDDCGDPCDLDCVEFDRTEPLTPLDTLTLLTRVHNPDHFQGYLYAYATNEYGVPVGFDHLIGNLLVVDGMLSLQYSVNPVDYRARVAQGVATDLDGDGVRDLNGLEYERTPGELLFPRFLGQGERFNGDLVMVDLSGGAAFDTTLGFLIYNDNEEQFSAQHTFTCWDKVPLLDVSHSFGQVWLRNNTGNNPHESLGGEEYGWFRMEGQVASSYATTIVDPAVYGFYVERVGSYSGADLPFEACAQSGHLLPRAVTGDNEEDGSSTRDCSVEPPARRLPASLLLYPEFDNRAGTQTVLTVTNTDRDEATRVHFVYRGRYGR